MYVCIHGGAVEGVCVCVCVCVCVKECVCACVCACMCVGLGWAGSKSGGCFQFEF